MDFKTLANILFTGKGTLIDKNKNTINYIYNELSDDDKESLFFIINRYLAKKYPKQAQYFNNKNQDKATALDIWNIIIKKEKTIPFWFWKGATKRKEPEIKDWKVFYEEVQDELNLSDIFLLCEIYPNEIKEEIKTILERKKEREKL